MKARLVIFLSALSFMLLGMTGGLQAQQHETGAAARRVIIFVWDGLRADDLTPEITPNYFALARSSVVFADHHAVYPTFTMMNSASIATGAYPGVHGFYGNVVYVPSAKGRNAREPISISPRRRSSRISAWSKPCATHTREGSRWFPRCCRPGKPKG
jgi:hypothetical protein